MIQDNGTRNQYSATSGQTVFIYTFEIFDDDDITVEQNGAVLTKGTHYSVSGVNVDTGGNITFVTGATTGDIITLYRSMALVRTADYQQNGSFLSDEIDTDLDRLWAAVQQNKTDLGASLRASVSDTILNSSNTELALPSVRGGKLLGFAADGTLDYISAAIAGGDFTDVSTTAAMTALTGVSVGDVVQYKEFSTGIGGSGVSEAVLTSGVTTNGQDIIVGVADPLISFQLRIGERQALASIGVVGDGVVDDTSAIQRALTLTGSWVGSQGKTYKVTAALTGANNIVIDLLCSTISFEATIANSTPMLSIGTDCHLSNLAVLVATTFTVNRGIVIGDRSRLVNVKCNSVDQQANTASNDHGAIRLQGDNIVAEDISTDKFDRCVNILGDDATCRNVRTTSYLRGLRVDQSRGTLIEGFLATIASTNATTDPGHNGLLVSETQDSTFTDIHVEDAGEHAVRIGSAATTPSSSLTFNNVQAIRPGQCGFKSFDDTLDTVDLTINGLTVVDCSFGGASSSNEDGLRLQNVNGANVTGFSVKKTANAGTSSFNGIYLSGCTDVNIASPRISDSSDSAILLVDTDGPVNQISITSPIINGATEHGIEISSAVEVLRDISITDIVVIGQTQYGVSIAAGGGISKPIIINGTVDIGGAGEYTSDSTDDQLSIDIKQAQINTTNTTLTIASGVVSPTTRAKQSFWHIETEAAASSDNLDTITAGGRGDVIFLRTVADARDVVLTETGNLILSASTLTLSHTDDLAMFLCTGANWQLVSFSDNGT